MCQAGLLQPVRADQMKRPFQMLRPHLELDQVFQNHSKLCNSLKTTLNSLQPFQNLFNSAPSSLLTILYICSSDKIRPFHHPTLSHHLHSALIFSSPHKDQSDKSSTSQYLTIKSSNISNLLSNQRYYLQYAQHLLGIFLLICKNPFD